MYLNIKSTYSSGILIAILVLTATLNADYIDDMQRSTVDSQRRKALIEAKSGNFNHALELIDNALQKENRDKSAVLCDKVMILYLANKPKAAAESFLQIKKNYPLPNHILPVAGKIFHQIRQDDIAIPFLEKALALNPKDKELNQILGKAYADTGAINKAIKLLDQQADINSHSKGDPIQLKEERIGILHLKGVYQARQGYYGLAEKTLRQASELSGADNKIIFDRIVNFVWAGKNHEALDLYITLPPRIAIPEYTIVEISRAMTAEGKQEQAIRLLHDYNEKNQRSKKAFDLYMQYLLASEKYQTAIDSLKTQERKDEYYPSIAAQMQQNAIKAGRNGKYDLADKMLQSAANISVGMEKIKIEYERLVLASWAGQYQLATEIFNTLPPDPQMPYYVMIEVAKSAMETGNIPRALNFAQLAKKKVPGSLDATKIIINCMIRQQHLAEALKTFRAANLKIRQEMTATMVDAMQQNAAEMARSGHYTESIKMLNEAYDLSKKNPQVQCDMVVVHSWAGHYQEALDLFESLPPNYTIPAYVFPEAAKACRELKQLNKARNFYSKALADNPKRSDAAQALVSLYANDGNYELAAKFIQERCGKYPSEEHQLRTILGNELKRYAVTEARNGNLENAIALMEKAKKANTGDMMILCDYVTVLAWGEKYQEAINIYKTLPTKFTVPAYVEDAIGKAYRSTGKYDTAAEHYYKALQIDHHNKDAMFGFIVSKIEAGKEDEAVKFLEKEHRISGIIDPELLTLFGNAYLDTGKIDMAEKQYLQALKINSKSSGSLIGMSRIMVMRKNWTEALKYADSALTQSPSSITALYAKAEALEASDDFMGAYECYDKISAMPDGERAIDAKYRVLSQLGAAGLSLEMIDKSKKKPSQNIYEKILADQAAARISRNEAVQSLSLIDSNITRAKQNESRELLIRSRYDKILANQQTTSMQQIVADYEALQKEKLAIPFWIESSAGDAYLYLRQAEKALKTYQSAQKKRTEAGMNEYPDNFEIRMAIYYCLVELERYQEAGILLDGLEKDSREYGRSKGNKFQNWEATSITIERIWWLIYQDRFIDAEQIAKELLKKEPCNAELLSAIAYLHYYRGWPRRSLEDFKVAKNLDPDDTSTRIGMAYALNENGEGELARKQADELKKEFPANLSIDSLVRSFKVEDMRTETINFSTSQEQTQSDGFSLSQRLEQPIYPQQKVYVETVWKHILRGGLEDETLPDSKEMFRNGGGIDWRVARDLTINGGGSIDYQGEHPGGNAGFKYDINDQWNIIGNYNSYSLNLPASVFLKDGYAQEYDVGLNYRKSEDFESNINFSQMFVSDNNIMSTVSARQDKAFFTHAFWKPHFALEESLSINKDDDVDYYSPNSNIYLYAVPYIEHIWYRHYEFKIVDRFYVAPGLQLEDNCPLKFAGYLKYEQEWTLTDTISIRASITGTRKNYDGEGAYGFTVESGLVWHF